MGRTIREPSIKPPSKMRNDICPYCGNKKRTINGAWLRWKRERVGLDQRTVANILGFSGPYISDIERNRRNCPESVIGFYKELKDTK